MAYEVAVACDVALGEIIRNSPEVSSIDIDPLAVSHVIDAISQPSASSEPRELLVIANHHKTLQSEKHSNLSTSGVFTPATKSKSGIATVNVAVAGNPLNFKFPDPDAFIAALDAAAKTNKPMEQAAEAMKTIGVINPISGPAEIQATTVHELSHAADDLDLTARQEARRYRQKRFGASLGSAVLTNSLIVAAFNVDVTQEVLPNPTVFIAANAGVTAVANWLMVKNRNRNNYKHYLAAPDEARARQLELSALTYPQIITIR